MPVIFPKGLYTKLLIDENERRNILVVGQDEEATEKLYKTLEAEKQRAEGGIKFSSGTGLINLVSKLASKILSAVVGAVARFTRLAFS